MNKDDYHWRKDAAPIGINVLVYHETCGYAVAMKSPNDLWLTQPNELNLFLLLPWRPSYWMPIPEIPHTINEHERL